MSKAVVQSPNVNFRELDDEDLQKRAKEWFQAVVGDAFEDQGLADALADGDILYRVAKVFRELLYKSGSQTPTPSRSSSENDLESKKSGKYLPYSNVDSFLKICKTLSLPDVDLFTPPDVVEKKDIRRVCLCIRALSKKARAHHLKIPDFDNVAGTSETLHYDSSDGMDPVEWAGNNSSIKDSLFSPWSKSSFETFLRESGSELSREATASVSYRDVCQESNGHPPSLEAANAQDLHTSGTFIRSTGQSGRNGEYFDVQKNYSEYSLPSNSERSNKVQALPLTGETFDNKQTHGRDLSSTTNSKGKARKGRRLSLWLTIFAGAVTLVGVVLARRPRDMEIYEVKAGDTLSDISRRTGKTGWQKLAELNPDIKDPNLIYPNERLKLYR